MSALSAALSALSAAFSDLSFLSLPPFDVVETSPVTVACFVNEPVRVGDEKLTRSV